MPAKKTVFKLITPGIIIAVIMAVNTLARADGLSDCKNIATDKGPVSGVLSSRKSLCAYKGVPYAAPPIGDLRFAKPREHDPWVQPLEAKKFGNECLQYPLGLVPDEEPKGSEDCLYLNIWQPLAAAREPKPVMVFIHGGGFANGSGSMEFYWGDNLASGGDVIVVTINYRLAVFGFMGHVSLRDEQGRSGNYGIYDQIAALEWIRKNIASFGGDPGNVTIFGESAGGISVALLMLSPVPKGLFHKAVIQSGPIILTNTTQEQAEATGLTIAEKLGCGEPAAAAQCLRSVDADTIMKNVHSGIRLLVNPGDAPDFYSFGPVVDGNLIPDVPLRMFIKGELAASVPVIVGSNKDEAALFVIRRQVNTREELDYEIAQSRIMLNEGFGVDLDFNKITALYDVDSYPTLKKAFIAMVTDTGFTCPTIMQAAMLSAQQPNTYLYHFSKNPGNIGMFKDLGAFHGAELPFLFGNFSFMGLRFDTRENLELSGKIIKLWSSFARTGVPSVEGIPAWPPFDNKSKSYINLNTKITIDHDLKADKCAVANQIILDAFGVK